jgi:hypothetical protein
MTQDTNLVVENLRVEGDNGRIIQRQREKKISSGLY